MYRKIVATRFGGPEVLEVAEVAGLPEPAPGEARIRVLAAGVGYTDTIVRRGRYVGYKGGLPVTPGYDMIGIVDALGLDVSGPALGTRVADMTVSGAYSQYIVRPARGLVPVPEGVPDAAAIEVPLMWATAWQMLTRIVRLEPGAIILVVGAGGSAGRALVALARYLGLLVIGTGSAGSLSAIEAEGAIAIDHRREDLVDAIRAACGGTGVAAAFDAIGGESWTASWRSLARGGTLVGYGLQAFLDSGSSNLTAIRTLLRFKLWNLAGRLDGSRRRTVFYNIQSRRAAFPDDYAQDAGTLLDLIATRQMVPREAEILPLDQAMDAHVRIGRGGLAHRLVLAPWGTGGPALAAPRA